MAAAGLPKYDELPYLYKNGMRSVSKLQRHAIPPCRSTLLGAAEWLEALEAEIGENPGRGGSLESTSAGISARF